MSKLSRIRVRERYIGALAEVFVGGELVHERVEVTAQQAECFALAWACLYVQPDGGAA